MKKKNQNPETYKLPISAIELKMPQTLPKVTEKKII